MQAPSPSSDTKARDSIKQGYLWLGGASIVAQVVDVISSIVILWFLSKAEMGVATLAWSLAVILESFNGLGVGTALLQRQSLSSNEKSTLFWFASGFGLLCFLVITPLSPWIARFYGSPELVWMIIFSSMKLPVVGLALVPLQLLNRELRFKEIGAIQTINSIASSTLKIGLAIAGFGAWSLIIAHLASGLITLGGAWLRSRYIPKAHFALNELKPFVSFGSRVTASGIIFHFYRNADYLIVGKLLGKEILGVYRVAFELAMSPALALLNVVNRASFPVFAKLSGDREELSRTFTWTQRNLSLVVAPIALFLAFAAEDIVSLIGRGEWRDAVPAIRILSAAAFMRTTAQTFPQLFHAVGKPSYAVYDSLITAALMVCTIMGFIHLWGSTIGMLAVCIAWVVTYPIALACLIKLSSKLIPLKLSTYMNTFRPTLAASALAAIASFLFMQLRPWLPMPEWTHTIGQGLIILSIFILYVRYKFGLSLKELTRGAKSREIQQTSATDATPHAATGKEEIPITTTGVTNAD